ncbi:MAG: hypothetical protein SXV54_18565 [Chloroflexota bacterium]|nr:hypothetical protein [Chloroflexota bacterium]
MMILGLSVSGLSSLAVGMVGTFGLFLGACGQSGAEVVAPA